MKMIRRTALATLLIPLLIGLTSMLARADFPEKPITIIYPWAPGDPVEVVLREIGKLASKELGQPFVINNVRGAGGTKSMTAGAQATPDGYTLLNNFVAPQIGAKLFNPKLPYSNDSYIPIVGVFAFPFTVTVVADHPANTVQEFITWANAQGRKLNYGVCAPQSVPRLVGEQFMISAGIAYNPIPNSGGCGGDNMTGLLNGTLDASVGVVPFAKKFPGQIKFLGMITDERHPIDPNLPTVTEQGVKIGWGDAAFGWGGLVVPKGTPDAVVARLREVIGPIVQGDELKKELGPLSPMVRYVSPEDSLKLWEDSMDLLRPHVDAILKAQK